MNKFLTIFLTLLSSSFLFSICNSRSNVAESEKKNNIRIEKNIIWASPKGFDLTMDIYIPQTGKLKYPVLVVFHGGGWLINNNSIMNEMSQYVSEHSEYIVCNVNYRLLGDVNNTTTMNEMIEDVMGAVLWIKENISKYKGDSLKIAITGDSAGGHLAAMILYAGDKLNSERLTADGLYFKPTYLPQGLTAEQVAQTNGLDVQAAILSYTAFDIYSTCLGGLENQSNFFWSMAGKTARGIFGDTINIHNNPSYYFSVSPIRIIPRATERRLPPQLCTVGTKDMLTTPVLVRQYVDSVNAAGHSIEYWEYEGRNHAFLDSGSNQYLGTSFEKDGPIALNKMIDFLNKHLK